MGMSRCTQVQAHSFAVMHACMHAGTDPHFFGSGMCTDANNQLDHSGKRDAEPNAVMIRRASPHSPPPLPLLFLLPLSSNARQLETILEPVKGGG